MKEYKNINAIQNGESYAIEIGDRVEVIIRVWNQDEQPTAENFYTGLVTEIIERAKNCFYVKIDGLDRIIPIDRAILV